jgi:hypothetical protein
MKATNKQTAVEWLFLMLNNPNRNQDFANKLLEKAKAMEKEQIINAYSEGQNTPYEYSEDNEINWYDGLNYYTETYESNI